LRGVSQHWQISTAQELKGLPQFRKVIPFTAYAEGWALYCECLAKKVGWYDSDPFGDLGRLQAELFRAVRLLVDTAFMPNAGHPSRPSLTCAKKPAWAKRK